MAVIPWLNSFPWANFPPLQAAVAYGSALRPHSGGANSKSSPPTRRERMVDFIFIIQNGKESSNVWHAKNIVKRRHDYSFLKRMGSSVVAAVQMFGSTKVYVNSMVRLEGLTTDKANVSHPNSEATQSSLCKYTTISETDAMHDLVTWRSLFLPGRLHKSFRLISAPTDLYSVDSQSTALLLSHIEANRLSALKVALLLLPDCFTFKDLLYEIISISYVGDIRMKFKAERADEKMESILAGHALELFAIYYPLLVSADLTRLCGDSILPLVFHDARSIQDMLCLGKALDSSAGNFHSDGGRADKMTKMVLSDTFIFKKYFTPDVNARLFDSLPLMLRKKAASRSLLRRFFNILRPNSIGHRSFTDIGLTAWDPSVLRSSIKKMAAKSSRSVALKSLLCVTPMKLLTYVQRKYQPSV